MKNIKMAKLSLGLMLGLTSLTASALTLDEQLAKMNIDKKDITITDVKFGNAKEVMINGSGEKIYFNEDMTKVLAGKMFDIKNGEFVDPAFAKLDTFKDTMIEYKAPNEKYVVTAFVDITCHYCKLLHQNMKEYNDLGITFRYLAFPREGIDGSVAKQMESIFTSENKAQAYTDVENGKKPEEAKTVDVVKKHYQMGLEFGINGTPALILPNGQTIPGFLKPDQLIKTLENK